MGITASPAACCLRPASDAQPLQPSSCPGAEEPSDTRQLRQQKAGAMKLSKMQRFIMDVSMVHQDNIILNLMVDFQLSSEMQ